MLSVDRNVMRVAVVEMLLGETPMKVAIDEAIEIAREYGSEDSAKFVNGVLDLIYQRLEKREAGGSD
jgi:N utilization substance protein B